MSGLFTTTKIDSHLDGLFKQSAGKSEIAVKPLLPEKVFADIEKKKKKQEKKEGNKAFLGFKKAKELLAASLKRKAEELAEKEEPEKKKIKKLTEEEKLEKEQRTVFLGNVPVACIEKGGYKQLKSKFKECGKIESIRFRSVAFSEPMDRKSAFLARKLHSSRDVLNAYIVFEQKESVAKAVELNGTVFMDKHVRVDSAVNNKVHDRKRSVFLGGLPFDAEEEELWEHFKECGQIEFVRIIRDAKTNVGKGFGYVQFKERDDVDAALANEKKFRNKTKIRVQRCKIPVSEGGVPDKKPKKKGGKKMPAKKPSGKSGKPLPAPKRFEGTRATKDDGSKFKLIKTSKKKVLAKKKQGKK
ncbi:hypothetical protein G6F57_008581 [Rhizopus arrhizus]|uniref:Nucleolar protein 12 n=1 Tax=Rhizopus oryzae TaxID=64495 RepID=A0A9P6X740_RHIOR|nr:hypothetical protein G6F23_004108 [Rhizopus arrhizus]KAG1414646.1 hypothetical protein G6F58_006848 [Rhizopus delemar]KAG0760309.1 hypothetical protein G6F24_008412 [Rhizopus arrhizus]KAG0785908.1 hypothetical protein G6F21_008952 [Rhizopus arrhizus]KAG0790140.1 hypothetical protein G6F22_006496 [Rhizopus arrhizus]